MFSVARIALAALIFGASAFAEIPAEWTAKFDKNTGLAVKFGSTKLQDGIQLFNATPEAQPSFALTQSSPQSPTARYTILFVDPDFPSPKNSISPQYLHFLATDFKIGGPDKTLVTDTNRIHIPYTSPTSAAGSGGVHRYVFLMYAQKGDQDFKKGTLKGFSEDRKAFNLKEFQEKSGLGEPIAGIHFLQEVASHKKRATTFRG